MKSYNTTADRQLVTINILSNISLSSLVICNSNLTLKSIKFSYIIHQRPYLETLFHLNKNCKTLQVTDCIFLYEATLKLDLLFPHRIFTGNMLSVNFMRSVFIVLTVIHCWMHSISLNPRKNYQDRSTIV